jgi:hypothetical protein
MRDGMLVGGAFRYETGCFRKPTYPFNLCPFLGCLEFPDFSENLGEPIKEAIQ